MVKCKDCLNLSRTVGVTENQPFDIEHPKLRLDRITSIDFGCSIVPKKGEVVKGFGGVDGIDSIEGFDANEERECKNFKPLPKA